MKVVICCDWLINIYLIYSSLWLYGGLKWVSAFCEAIWPRNLLWFTLHSHHSHCWKIQTFTMKNITNWKFCAEQTADKGSLCHMNGTVSSWRLSLWVSLRSVCIHSVNYWFNFTAPFKITYHWSKIFRTFKDSLII